MHFHCKSGKLNCIELIIYEIFLYANTRQIVKTIKKGDFFSSMPFCKGKDDQVSPLHRDFRILGSSLKGEEEGGRFKVRGGGERGRGVSSAKPSVVGVGGRGGSCFPRLSKFLVHVCALEGYVTENGVRWRGYVRKILYVGGVRT